MGDLAHDTVVEGGQGRYRADLSPDWEIWGPMGGYVAAVALRAAAAEAAPGLLPASVTAQFLSSARFDAVDIEVRVRRSSRRAALVATTICQDATPVLDLQAWFTAPADVIDHDHVGPHPWGVPDEHADISTYTSETPFPFWRNFERRPIDWIDDFATAAPGAPEWAHWVRFAPTGAYDDPVLEACRLVLLADLPSFPAAIRAHPQEVGTWVTPSLDLNVQLHRLDDVSDWLLVWGTAPLARKGLMGFRSEVRTAAGRLAASGGGQLAQRRVSPPPQG